MLPPPDDMVTKGRQVSTTSAVLLRKSSLACACDADRHCAIKAFVQTVNSSRDLSKDEDRLRALLCYSSILGTLVKTPGNTVNLRAHVLYSLDLFGLCQRGPNRVQMSRLLSEILAHAVRGRLERGAVR